VDREGRLLDVNPAFERFTGWSTAEWVGRSFTDLIHPDDLPMAIETFQQASSGETPQPYELRIANCWGGYTTGEFASTPDLVGGEVVGEFGIARDVSARKRPRRS